MAESKHHNPHLTVRPVLVAWAVVVVVFTAVIFFIIGLNYTEESTPTTQIEDNSVVSAPPVPEIPSATGTNQNSTTYKNSEFGFKFSLPNGYSVQEKQSYEGARGVGITFGKEKSTNVSDYNFVDLQYFVDNSTLATLEKNLVAENGTDLSDRKELTIDGHPAISYMVGGFASGKTIISSNGTATIKISVYPDNNETRAFADNLASSFKF